MPYEATDITHQTYVLLRRKRKAARRHREALIAEGNQMWYDMLMGQTECSTVPYEHFRERMARYIFVCRK